MIETARPSTDAVAPRPRPRAPFAPLRLYAVTAGLYAIATAVWTLAGGALPGGRWLAVHLFTLGVVTNVVPAFTRHFGTTLARHPEPWRWWPAPALNAGILTLSVGMVVGSAAAVAVGGTVVTALVIHNWWDLRTKRRKALAARFGWVIRMYERAHGAFIHGAILGILMGTGVLGGAWYGTARLAHLHVNVLGWAGLTFLATLVFFGPTVLRVRIEEGADARARRWLPLAATGLTVGVLAPCCRRPAGGCPPPWWPTWSSSPRGGGACWTPSGSPFWSVPSPRGSSGRSAMWRRCSPAPIRRGGHASASWSSAARPAARLSSMPVSSCSSRPRRSAPPPVLPVPGPSVQGGSSWPSRCWCNWPWR